MDLKIFFAGFSEAEFNNFCRTHIIYKMHMLENGSIYVFWKNAAVSGQDKIERIEILDGMKKEAQKFIAVHSIDKDVANMKIADLKEQQSKLHTNEKEWDEIEKKIKVAERQVLMAEDSIREFEPKIIAIDSAIMDLSKDLETQIA